jgi:DNA helicase IV
VGDDDTVAQRVSEPIATQIAQEQAYLDAAYARLEAMRAAAESVRTAYADVRAGGPHQARLERDIAYDITERRLTELDIGNSPLCFGRLDRNDALTWYVGRLAVDDADHTPLVVDWRAPVAEPFYRATAIAPMGVARRRHFITRGGREITGLDDEVFDVEATAAAGLTVAGEGALLAALNRHRTGRMGDIVATIQSEQDEAIRAELAGVLIVAGGPGTGKTAVALHRAAYLLYTHRRRLAGSGVLLIGPSAVFLRYIEQVLPSLGEQDVQLATLPGLKPHLESSTHDRPPVAALKGDGRMAAVIQRAVADRERGLAKEINFIIDGLRVRITRDDTARIARSARRQNGTHNSKRLQVQRRLIDTLLAQYKRSAAQNYQRLDTAADNVLDLAGPDPLVARALARREGLPEGFDQELADRLRRRPEIRETLERIWPVLSGAELVNDLLGFRALVRSASRDVLRDDEQELLHRPRSAEVTRAHWTDADVALIDEADALLGPIESALPKKKRRRSDGDALSVAERVVEEMGLGSTISAAQVAARFNEDPDTMTGAGEARVFGHVLVDEAQDLTAMQWRMLARRCPSGSFTIVGDPGQASRPGALAGWDAVTALLPTHNGVRHAMLSVNYRTPAEIMEVAARLLAVAAPQIEPSISVRSTGAHPEFVAVGSADLFARAAELTRAARQRGGTVAVIAPASMHHEVVRELADLGAIAGTADALDAPVAVLDSSEAKGLEFDHVIVIEPQQLVTADRAGLRLLYVTITRATQTLAIVHAEPLPEGLEAR